MVPYNFAEKISTVDVGCSIDEVLADISNDLFDLCVSTSNSIAYEFVNKFSFQLQFFRGFSQFGTDLKAEQCALLTFDYIYQEESP